MVCHGGPISIFITGILKLKDIWKKIPDSASLSIIGKENPDLKNKVIFTLAADHGITEEGVSAYPKEVTSQMVYNFLRGEAGINVLAKHIGARVVVADLGVCSDLKPHPQLAIKKINYGTKNMTFGPAMTRSEATRDIKF